MQGHEVIGVTLRLADLTPHGLAVSRCCSPNAMAAAAQAADRLGIPHLVVDSEGLFEREVIRPFIDEYLSGRTPSPCVRCNSRVKFSELFELAESLAADAVATGHYARVRRRGDGTVGLCRAADPRRDQSYFLFELTAAQLSRVLFPLGEMEKGAVRRLAERLGLASAFRRDSQEVCFVPEGRSYVEVIEALASERAPGPGLIVKESGEVLGRHGGVHRFTVGQRRGLGLGGGERRYVVAVEAKTGRVVVGDRDAASRREISVSGVVWPAAAPAFPIEVEVQVRSRHEPARATVVPLAGERASVRFEAPVLAPAPGQAAVFYRGDEVVGGGWIDGWDVDAGTDRSAP